MVVGVEKKNTYGTFTLAFSMVASTRGPCWPEHGVPLWMSAPGGQEAPLPPEAAPLEVQGPTGLCEESLKWP